jgi:hypothetical protein
MHISWCIGKAAHSHSSASYDSSIAVIIPVEEIFKKTKPKIGGLESHIPTQ